MFFSSVAWAGLIDFETRLRRTDALSRKFDRRSGQMLLTIKGKKPSFCESAAKFEWASFGELVGLEWGE